LAEECLKLFSERNITDLTSGILDGRLNPCGGALVVSLFESGLLDKTRNCYVADNMKSAVGMENNTVFYSEVSFV
jgi:predicted PP-loop superfamily ATPase